MHTLRSCLIFVASLALAACSTSTTPAPAKGGLFFGTYRQESNITEPKPRQSEYLQTVEGGFAVIKGSAAYVLRVAVRKLPPTPCYIRVEYTDPLNKTKPFVNDMVFKPEAREFVFSSPGVVPGLQMYQTYSVRVVVLPDKASTTPIDVLVQPIRSYVDTTTDKVRVFGGLRPTN